MCINIWIVRNIAASVAGYATAPVPNPSVLTQSRDGIVIKHSSFGKIGTAINNGGNTLAHEAGHYFSLYHTWGDDDEPDTWCHTNAESLSKGDRVPDTAPCLKTNFGSCVQNTCNLDIPDMNDPLESYMSYQPWCHDRFTAGQAERMFSALNELRTELWSQENNICTGLNDYHWQSVNVVGNAIWSPNFLVGGGITIHGDVTVKSGASLTIETGMVVRFCGDAKLIVEPNATLSLSGTLTNSCGAPWKGVEVWGDNSQSQYSTSSGRAQGRIIGKAGSVIENALIGVQLWGLDKTNDAGGQINCTSTTFRNNKIAVEFAKYANFYPFPVPAGLQGKPRDYFGTFTNCTFITDNDYNFTEPFHSFLKMAGVNGVKINGCSFTNSQTLISPNEESDYGYGIHATDAGFRVEPTCNFIMPDPCNSFLRSSFTGLGYGVYVANILGNKPYLLKQADFTGCFVGVRNLAVSNATILFNHFNLGSVPNTTVTNTQFGMVFEGDISGFTFEENDFTRTLGNASQTIGTLSKNISWFNNIIRRNNYSNLSKGNLSNGQNGFGATGLNYLCNVNNNNFQHDFSVAYDNIFNSAGIRANQGVATTNTGITTYNAAGNRFSNNSGVVHFGNFGNTINYHYNSQGTNELPLSFMNMSNIVAQPNTCSVTYCEPPCKTHEQVAMEKEKYYDDRTKEELAKEELAIALLNGEAAVAEEKEKEAAYYKQQMDKEAYMVVIHLLHDTLMFHQDTLDIWLQNLDIFGMDMFFALRHQSNGNTVAAQGALERAGKRKDLSETQKNDLNDMPVLLSILNRKSPYQLGHGDLKILELYSVKDESFVGIISRNILTYYGNHFPITIREPKEGNETGMSSIAEIESNRLISIYPNPTDGVINLYWKSSNTLETHGKFLLSDVNGKVLRNIDINLNEPKTIQLNDVQAGLYYYRLQTESGFLDSGKLIIQ